VDNLQQQQQTCKSRPAPWPGLAAVARRTEGPQTEVGSRLGAAVDRSGAADYGLFWSSHPYRLTANRSAMPPRAGQRAEGRAGPPPICCDR